jgi:polyisoprenoid-binding protein YceI
MKTHIALLAAATALAATAHAEKIAFDLKDPKGVNNIVFKLDAPLESINGTANGISGTVLIDPAQPEVVEGKIVVDTKSLVVPNSVMQEHMLGADWLDAESHPEISFEVKEVLNPVKSSDTEGTADVKGVFTLKGVSKEITAPAKVTYLPGRLADRTNGQMEGDLIVIRTNFQINRSDFGIKAGENLDKVSETIDISLSIAGAAPKS